LTALAAGAALLVSIGAFIGAEIRWSPISTDSTPQHWVYPKLLEIAAAIDLFRLERGSLPQSLSVLEPEYIRKLPDDGWGNAFVYRVASEKPGYLLYSRGRNGFDESGNGDDITTEWKAFTCEQYEEVCWTPGKVILITSLVTGLLSAIALLGIVAISAYRFFRIRRASKERLGAQVRSSAAPWSIGAFSLASEITICVYLTLTMRASYGSGEGTFLLGVIPAVAMLFYSYHLQRFGNLWACVRSPQQRYGTALTWQIVGAICGLGALYLAFLGGPHVAPFFVLWGFLLQIGAIWVARGTLMPKNTSGGGDANV
jgi:hypothetical protein